ncbi:MAG: hypothetical protein HOV96_40660 [Nonomuraea sp.]|nr:hypothetical protein [Nonomuraea sp.]
MITRVPRIDIRLGVWGTATLDFRAARCPHREVLPSTSPTTERPGGV